MPAILAQDLDSGLIDYGDTDILHKDHDAVVLTFLDFYRQGKSGAGLKNLVFDSNLTAYTNLYRSKFFQGNSIVDIKYATCIRCLATDRVYQYSKI